jgi:hypothetical protein
MSTRAGLVLLLSGLAGSAAANPRPLPFCYTAETLPAGALAIEQIVDLTPVPTLDNTGAERTVPRATLTTEFELGLTGNLELGLVIQLADDPLPGSEGALRFDGLKQRLRWRLTDPESFPVGVALYGELAELRNEIEVAGKVIIQRHLGPVRLLTNLWAEREFQHAGQRQWVLHPTFGAAYEPSPRLALGLEGWFLQEIPDRDHAPPGSDRYNNGPLVYLGPTVFARGGEQAWLSLGAYTRLSSFNRPGRLGDRYGRFWVRLMLGLGL